MFQELMDLAKRNEILDNHTDGSCFKLTIEYTDFEDVPFDNHIKYCEDFDNLLEYALKYKEYQEETGRYIIDFRIQDDSK